MEDKKKLVIVTGSSRGIGKAFLDHYTKEDNTVCYGLSRSNSKNYHPTNLFDSNQAYDFVKQLDMKDIGSVFYMHSIGIDKFEPDGKPHIDVDGDGIDDEIYQTNVAAYLNLAEPLIDKICKEKLPVQIVNIGSISDTFNVSYWQSFTKAKNIVRNFGKSINTENIQDIMLNVSSTLDEYGDMFGRINADVTYWQTTDELLDKAVPYLKAIAEINTPHSEASFFKYNPNFTKDYFTNLPKLYKTWQRDMGFKEDEPIPHGIRI